MRRTQVVTCRIGVTHMTPLCVFALHDQTFGAHGAAVAVRLALLG